MTKSTLWTLLAVIGAIVVAWIVVEIVFSVLGIIFGVVGFLFKVVIVAAVAAAVYFVIRGMMRRSSDD